MHKNRNVWILEDEEDCRYVYQKTLEFRYDLRFFPELQSCAEALRSDQPLDLLIADLRLKDGNFLRFLAEDEASGKLTVPFVIVSSIADLDVLRAAFDEGASDYLTKPFKTEELIVKIERLLTPRPTRDEAPIQVDMTRFQASNGGEKVDLTPKEAQLLSFLSEAPQSTATRAEMLAALWDGVSVAQRTVDVHIFNLRKKIRPLGMDIRFTPPNAFSLIKRSDGSAGQAPPS